jgi:hypothetical protein
MSIRIRDPLSLLPYQSGLVSPPLEADAAKGQTQLDVKQRAVVIGEVIPIVFCRRVDDIGGVLVSPGATEGRFENDDTTNELEVKYRLILSEGNLDLLGSTDLFQGPCRGGTWNQVFDLSAGTWTPGNFIVEVEDKKFWDCPLYCGTGGSYEGLTVLSFEKSYPDEDDTWDKQVHVFARGGIKVTRILDDTLGPSNNVIDLALYLIRNSSRFPEGLLDLVAMESAALFCDVNGFYYNGEFKNSSNLEDWLEKISSDFLLRVSDKEGKKGLRPRLPVNNDGTIDTSPVAWVYTFTEEHLLPDGFQIDYISLEDRKPICAQVLWRQQPDDDIGVIRTMEVRMDGLAEEGPFEQYDLTQFCAAENHAAKIGAYRVAARYYITHTLRLQVRPDSFNPTLTTGDIVRVQLRRETTTDQVTYHNYLYEVERIGKNVSGIVDLDLVHFPVNQNGESLLALAVDAAEGEGIIVDTGREDFSCDSGATIDDDGTEGTGQGGTGYRVPIDNSGEPQGAVDNPSDPYTGPLGNGITGDPTAGSTLEAQPVCATAQVNWYKIPKNANTWNAATGQILDYSAKVLTKTENVVGGNPGSLVLTTEDIDYIIYAEWRCADPASPDGYGTPVPAGNTTPVEPDFTQYEYFRWTGTATATGGSIEVQSTPWLSRSLGFRTYGIGGVFDVGGYKTNTAATGNLIGGTFGTPTLFPWRANAIAVKVSPLGSGFSGGGWEIGDFGIYPNPRVRVGCVPFPQLPEGTVLGSLQGRFEFSTNGVNAEISWTGRDY